MRGSPSAGMASPSTSRTRWLTRRIRSVVIRIHHLPLHEGEIPLPAREVALGLVQQPLRLTVLARDAREGQPRALPDVVVVDLRDGGAHVLEPLLGGPQMLPLLLERVARGEVELAREDADEAAAHGPIVARAAADVGGGRRPDLLGRRLGLASGDPER